MYEGVKRQGLQWTVMKVRCFFIWRVDCLSRLADKLVVICSLKVSLML